MSSSPTVSVVIPTYNAAKYIGRAVDSVLEQTFGDYEVIVVDDGSTDDTARRLAQYGTRVRYIRQTNQERSVARNNGILAATGRYIAFLDADDYWHPDKLSKQLAVITNRPDVALVYSWAQCFFESHELPLVLGRDFAAAETPDIFAGLLLGKSLPTLTVLVERLAVFETGLFDPQITIIEDWDMWLRLSVRHKVALVPEILAYYRLSGKFLPAAMARVNVPDSRVKSVERALQEAINCPVADVSPELARQALSQAWWYGSLINYAVGNVPSGQDRLSKSLSYDPEFHFLEPAKWVENLIAFASYLYDYNTPRVDAENFLNVFFDYLPEEAQELRKRRAAALGWLRAGYAFRMLDENGPEHEARELMRQALRTYPPLARNLGAVSISLRNTWLDVRRLGRWVPKSARRTNQPADHRC